MSIANTHFGAEGIKKLLEDCRSIFFIGIGGINMSSIAHISHERGYRVGGSDRTGTALTERLAGEGIEIKFGHSRENVEGYDAVVYTVAISEDNPEYVYAKEKGLPCISRADFLGYIMTGYAHRIGVSGMHGKSTCTSMLAHVFMDSDADPTVMSGAELSEMGGAYRIGRSENFIFEACEYMDSFLSFYPSIAIVLNIEMDHVDYFHSMDQIRASFAAFADRTLMADADRRAVLNFDDADVRALADGFAGEVVSFGVNSKNVSYRACNVSYPRGRAEFDILYEGVFAAHVKLSVPGEHNVYNALAAFAAAHSLGLDVDGIVKGLGSFVGAKRRMEFKGRLGGADVYDDYGHHPTEVASTLAGVAKMGYERVWCVYQPHTYSRTAELIEDFARAFDSADRVVLADIYAARETNTYGVTSERVASLIGEKAEYIDSFENIAKHLISNVCEGDVVIIMGAGDIYKVFSYLELCD